MEQIIFDAKAIKALQHEVSHLSDCLRYVPKPIRTIKWECDIFKKEVCLNSNLEYIVEKLERITKIIELAESGENENITQQPL